MDADFRDYFSLQWRKYFGSTELPICYYYTDSPRDEDVQETTHEHRCLIGNLRRVREGQAYVYDAKTPGCSGGKRYTGFAQTLRPNFEYFLSCGIPGKLEGERYKKSPELVKEMLTQYPGFQAPGKYLVFKRWDRLTTHEEPLAAVFFASGDVLSGLFTLANYDRADDQVIAPFGAGCASIVYYPYLEVQRTQPRCILGIFDVSARPRVGLHELTFAVPVRRLEEMARNMDESFLITDSWKAVRSRWE